MDSGSFDVMVNAHCEDEAPDFTEDIEPRLLDVFAALCGASS